MKSDIQPAAFLSYVHSDDDHDRGRITRIRERLEGEVRMHTGSPFKIFQDRNDLEWGQSWQERIETSLTSVIFLIPIITPSYFNSPACRSEFEKFADRENSLGSNQLILPLYYLKCDQMDDSTNRDLIGIKLRSRQYSDWRILRFNDLESPEVSKQLSSLAADIKARTASLADILAASEIEPGSSNLLDETEQSRSEAFRGEMVYSTAFPMIPPGKRSDSTSSLSFSADQDELVLRRLDPKTPSYQAYTTEFDEILKAESFLPKAITLSLLHPISTHSSQFETLHKRSIQIFEAEVIKWRGDKKIFLTILLDNSGSLRGVPITNLAAWSAVLAGILERTGVQVRVLGFTTRAWKGGLSREKWLEDGKPANPGRLNDIRYIIYKDFGEPVISSIQNFSVMLREGLLKENVDGEALLFARSDLDGRDADRKMIAVFSDGAPVDDSTLSVNRQGYLVEHLIYAINEVSKSDIDLMAIGLNYNLKRYYGEMSAASDLSLIGVNFFKLFRKAVGIGRRPKKMTK